MWTILLYYFVLPFSFTSGTPIISYQFKPENPADMGVRPEQNHAALTGLAEQVIIKTILNRENMVFTVTS